MQIETLDKKDNRFFKRTDLSISVKHEDGSTPSKDDIKKSLAGKSNVDESQVIVDYIFTKKGITESFAKVKILDEKPPVVEKKEEKKEETQNAEAQASESK